MKKYHKRDFPVAEIRRFMEPEPIVLVSSAWRGEQSDDCQETGIELF